MSKFVMSFPKILLSQLGAPTSYMSDGSSTYSTKFIKWSICFIYSKFDGICS